MNRYLRFCGVIGVGATVLGACSTENGERVGSSSAAITVATNYASVLSDMHYADVVAAKFPASIGGAWHWVIAVDNCSAGISTDPGYNHCDPSGHSWIGWTYSDGLTGIYWHPNLPSTSEPTMWGSPGTPSDGSTFAGWGGDSTIALIGNPPDGTQVIMATLAMSTHGLNSPSDIATLLSSNGGMTWGNPQYASTTLAGGIDTDQPQIVSNANPPYSTFVAWEASSQHIPPEGWFTSVDNTSFRPGSSSSAPNTWNIKTGTGNAFSAKQIFNQSNNGFIRPKMAVGTVQGCTDGPHEVVYFAWTDDNEGHGECALTGGVTNVNWTMTFFDNTANVWAPVTYPLANDPSYPRCVPENESGQLNDDLSNPSLATDGNAVAVVHNQSKPNLGTRIEIDTFQATCSGTHVDGNVVAHIQSPDPCYIGGLPSWCPPGHTGGNGTGGTYIVNDQWEPHVAFQSVSGTEYMLVTWYDTSQDPTNKLVRVNGAINTTGILGNPFYVGTTPTIFQLSNVSGGGQTIPWTTSIDWASWYDYQGIGVDMVNHTFLAAWGGDARLSTASGVWTTRVSTP